MSNEENLDLQIVNKKVLINKYEHQPLKKENISLLDNPLIIEEMNQNEENILENIEQEEGGESLNDSIILDHLKEDEKVDSNLENKIEQVDNIEPIENIEPVEKFEYISKNYDTLVLSGGSIKGMVILGSLQCAHDKYLLTNISNYIGTSSGSMICYLLAIGYTPLEIMVYICTNQLLEKLKNFNIIEMLNGKGGVSYENINEQLEKMTIKKIGFLPTLLELKQKFGKNLVCVTHNLTLSKTEYLDYNSYPDLPCLTAIKMSSNLPLVFEIFKQGDAFYVDGGISDNFAIDIGEKIGRRVLGIALIYENNTEIDVNSGIVAYIYKLMFVPIAQAMKYKIMQTTEKTTVIKISHGSFNLFNFDISSKDKLDMFTDGYNQMIKNLEIINN